MKSINFIIRLTEKCNMNCAYCYVNLQKRKQGKCISLSTIKHLYESIQNISPQYVEFVWHGGEPLLYNKKSFVKIMEMQREYKINNIVGNGVQTNATLIDKDWIQIFKEYRISVGVSIDYPPEHHDKIRIFWSEKPTFTKVLNNILTLKENGISITALSVITKDNYKFIEEIYWFFKKLNIDFKTIPCAPCEDTNSHIISKLFISPNEYGKTMVNLAKIYISDPNPTIHIIDIDDIIKSFFSGYNKNCMFVGQCSEFFGITPEGNIYVCDLFNKKDFLIGNLYEIKSNNDTNNTFLKHPIIQKIKLRIQKIDKCHKCKYFSICNGGCMSNSYFIYGSIYKEDFYCQARKILFAYLENVIIEQGYSFKLKRR